MSYEGTWAQIPLGQYGLLSDLPPGEVPRGALIRATNVSFETGMVGKAPGSIRYNLSALPAGIVGLHDWWPNTTTQRLIAACSNGKIYRDIGDRVFSGGVAIAESLGPLNPRCVFTDGGQETSLRAKKLFFFSAGLNQLKVLNADGEVFANVSAPAADWTSPKFPTFGFIHRNRLWAFMAQRAYASDTADHENFATNNLTQNVFPGEGGNLIGGYVFKGRAFVFKEGGFVYYLDDADPDSDNWNWRRLSGKFGLSSPHGLVEILDDMIGVNESGSPTSYAATDALGDIESADLLRQMQIENYFRSVTSNSGLSVLHSLYYETKKQAFFTWRTSHRTNNNALLMIDFNKQNPRPAIWTKDQADCLTLRRDALDATQKPIYGSADGYVYFMDRETRLTGDTGYTGEFKTSHDDFRWLDPSASSKNKLYDHLALEFIPTGNWTLYVDTYIDGKFIETINFQMDVRDDGLDSFTLDSGSGTGTTTPTGGDGDPLGREETQTITMPLHGSGRRISFHIRGTGANQNFTIASLNVGFRLSAEQATDV